MRRSSKLAALKYHQHEDSFPAGRSSFRWEYLLSGEKIEQASCTVIPPTSKSHRKRNRLTKQPAPTTGLKVKAILSVHTQHLSPVLTREQGSPPNRCNLKPGENWLQSEIYSLPHQGCTNVFGERSQACGCRTKLTHCPTRDNLLCLVSDRN